jgi:glycosyltransferase involved in cell wall biosynthesis
MRVLFLCNTNPDDGTNRYRCAHLAEALRQTGHRTDFVSSLEPRVTVAHDVVVLNRLPWTPPGARFVAAARAIGAKVVFGIDDLLFESELIYQAGHLRPDDLRDVQMFRGLMDSVTQTMEASDAVLCSTDFLALFARQRHGCVHTLRNFLPAELCALSERARRQRALWARRDDRVVLGYLSGSRSHDVDLADIAPALAGALTRFENARLLVVGEVALPLALRPFVEQGRVRRHPFVPWRELPGLIAQVDINLAPVDPTRAFNHAKSEIKFLEAAAVGVPTIATATEGVCEAVPSGAGCFLAQTTADWTASLERLIGDPEARRAASADALAFLTKRGTVATDAALVAALFEELAVGAAVTRSVVVTRPRRERLASWFAGTEATAFRRVATLQRHWRLLADAGRRGRAG